MNNNEEEIKKGIENEVNTKRQNYLLSMEVMSYIEKIFLNDSGLVSLLFGNIKYDLSKEYKISIVTSGINMFFIKELIIPPNRFRPENASFGGEENYYHYQTSAYRKILSLDNDIKEQYIKTYFSDLVAKCVQLQLAINTLFDSSKALSKKEQESKGIRQIIEKKEGILRMKMMGKRVNHSGLTVISPDPLIDTGEI